MHNSIISYTYYCSGFLGVFLNIRMQFCSLFYGNTPLNGLEPFW